MNNDLISRSELLEHAKGGEWDGVGFSKEYVNVDDIINAPPVETDIEVVAKDAYKQGYTDGWKERFGEPNERPQGELAGELANEVWKLYKKHQSHLATYVLEFGEELADLLGKYNEGGEE